MKKRPNILFLMSDEHRADVAGYEGNAIVRTPFLDELAARGTAFSHAYTPSPICIPGRQSMMAGQFPRHCGCEVYGEDLAPGHMTFSRRLSQYGYQTVACGKLHHYGPDQMQGWIERIGNDTKVAPSFIPHRSMEDFEKLHRPMNKWSDAKEIQRAGIGKGPVVEKDEYTVQGAIQFINHYFNSPYYDREQDAPLLLKVSLVQPHYPYLTSEEKFNYYLNRVQPYLSEKPSEHPFLAERQVVPGADASEREIRRATAAYYGMVETVDDMYRRVVSALEHAGQSMDDWVIIYTSDHGEMLGEHGIWEKQKFYEGSVRVPLLIALPGQSGQRKVVDENVNLCDLFATLCDITDIPMPDDLDSRSLLPLMHGEEDGDWDNESVSQFGGRNLMIKRDELKYQYYGPHMPEVLFDLAEDPGELENVIEHRRYAERVAEFRRRRKELRFGL
ncbi:sulfatase-like hydrolase/transferase [Paenibacillus sp. HB172176]|uniref:sulfatase-like hydrolase/transferase n=1 Tax=Paenibacillus sp. HB172176 TaxID=2493690 RepID=UPI001439A51E|nr:sulfatase-like hydrolase/transferase [Paenibacillus sp. HB172176]